MNLPAKFLVQGEPFNYFNGSNWLDLKDAFLNETAIGKTIFPANTFSIPAHSKGLWREKLEIVLSTLKGMLSFKLSPETKIVFQVENQQTGKKNDLFYTIEDLYRKAQLKEKYQQFLADDKNNFFYQVTKDSTIKMRFSVTFNLITQDRGSSSYNVEEIS